MIDVKKLAVGALVVATGCKLVDGAKRKLRKRRHYHKNRRR